MEMITIQDEGRSKLISSYSWLIIYPNGTGRMVMKLSMKHCSTDSAPGLCHLIPPRPVSYHQVNNAKR